MKYILIWKHYVAFKFQITRIALVLLFTHMYIDTLAVKSSLGLFFVCYNISSVKYFVKQEKIRHFSPMKTFNQL